MSREITGLALNIDELQKGRVTVHWDIFEQNDGGVIQLIYAGNTNVQIKADGVVEGQQQIERLEFTGRIKSPYEQYESERWGYRDWGILFIFLGGALLSGAWAAKRGKADYREAHNEYLKTIESFKGTYDTSIEWEAELIAANEKRIAKFEERVKECEREGRAELAETPKQWIAEYRKEQQESREKIKEYESRREEQVARKDKVIRDDRKEERQFDIVAIVAVTLALFAFAPAVYLLFIAQPVGPPFGF